MSTRADGLHVSGTAVALSLLGRRLDHTGALVVGVGVSSEGLRSLSLLGCVSPVLVVLILSEI